MNISKALKVKNRLVGKITKQQEIVSKENSRRSDSTSKVDVSVEFQSLLNLKHELIDLKSRISKASSPIFDKIIKMQEYKSLINYINGLNTRDGIEKVSYGQTTVIDYTWNAYINNEKKQVMIKGYEDEVNNLQDDIDNFNAVTSI